jgi:hypothetical protein
MDPDSQKSASRACDRCREMFVVYTARLRTTSLPESVSVKVFMDEMLVCSRTGCDLCTSISTLVTNRWGSYPSNTFDLSLELVDDWEPLLHIRLVETDVGGELLRLFCSSTLQLCVIAQPDGPAAGYYPRRFVETDISSDAVIHQAREWIRSCLTEHKEGPRRQGLPFLPTRVVDVSDLKLHLSCGERSTYAALSYCWGGVQSYVTTRATIECHTNHLKLEAMPATIRDAIRTTRDLGIRYLWIDALCIIQDSKIDKEVEITNMNKIYKDATVTIAAANASSVHDGFLAPRPSPSGIEVAFNCPGGQPSKVWLVQKEFYKEEDYGPLYYRAWALQERIVSPRLPPRLGTVRPHSPDRTVPYIRSWQ